MLIYLILFLIALVMYWFNIYIKLLKNLKSVKLILLNDCSALQWGGNDLLVLILELDLSVVLIVYVNMN